MDVRMFTGFGLSGGGEAITYDASDLSSDSSSSVVAGDRSDLMGIRTTEGLITGFRITPVPAPSVTALALAALITVFLFGLRQKHKPTTRKE
jgi:hypothetical protein